MKWKITYFNEKVRIAIDQWPVSIRAFYARTTENNDDLWSKSRHAVYAIHRTGAV